MNINNARFSRSASLITAAATALLLVACDQPVEPKTSSNVEQKFEKAMAKVAVSAEDLAITARIKAELAKDPDLSALRIKVDTLDGLVSLHGTAPDQSSREHATRVAAAVKGVLSVDNLLVVNS